MIKYIYNQILYFTIIGDITWRSPEWNELVGVNSKGMIVFSINYWF